MNKYNVGDVVYGFRAGGTTTPFSFTGKVLSVTNAGIYEGDKEDWIYEVGDAPFVFGSLPRPIWEDEIIAKKEIS